MKRGNRGFDTSQGEDRRSNAILIAALLGPLVFVVAMYLHAQRTERGRQAVVNGAMRDYAAVASWRFATLMGECLHQTLMNRLPVTSPSDHAGEHMVRPTGPGVFTFDEATGELTAADTSQAFAHRAELIRMIREERAKSLEDPHRARLVRFDGQPRLVLLALPRASTRAAGFLMTPVAFERVLEQELKFAELLPKTLVRPPFDSSRIAIRVGGADNVLRNAPVDAVGWFVAHDTTRWGDFR